MLFYNVGSSVTRRKMLEIRICRGPCTAIVVAYDGIWECVDVARTMAKRHWNLDHTYIAKQVCSSIL